MLCGGMLGAAPDTQALVPQEPDTGQILEAKWKKWIQRESFKRFAHPLPLYQTIYTNGSPDSLSICFSMIPEPRLHFKNNPLYQLWKLQSHY